MENTTCQICGRPIKAKNGIIAHHGYKRPEYGWQTASCMGARHQPYEVACDVNPQVIDLIETHIAKVFSKLESLIVNPPATLEHEKRNHTAFGKWTIEVKTAVRPADFNPNERLYYSEYEGKYFSAKHAMEQDLKHSNFQLTFLKERLANWKEVK